MPLPALPANNTARLFVDYTTGRLNHSLVVRYDGILSLSQVTTGVATFLEAVRNVLPQQWAVTGARVQEAGSLFSLPTALGDLDGFVGTNGSPTVNENDEPRQVTFTGRSLASGRNVRVGLFGLLFTTPSTYRLTRDGLATNVGSALDVLAAQSFGGVFVAIDGANVLWNQYANVNYNSYWESDARG